MYKINRIIGIFSNDNDFRGKDNGIYLLNHITFNVDYQK